MTQKPLKRHSSLIPISQKHHDILVLAQLISSKMPVYKGKPSSFEERKQYALSFYTGHLKSYFKNEQFKVFSYFSGHDSEIDKLIQEISAEQEKIIQLFEQLSENENASEVMNQISTLLIHNIRLQERKLFQLIQQRFSDQHLSDFKP
ncbi:hypothetical protein C3K47_00070 [Solitalea longa]|uniref:Hemerythrin-like domain-containing protein n=1 Tax=Solitalea longa TaxID=2079460 RepID=A0A2S5A8V3_9SPHI|nr:hypothetical protein [Solitalea longa]POY38934.1 hypothetical protein C3K47_00070 [Solitalea longa]